MATLKWVDDRYQIIDRLGGGATSTVYRAIDRKDQDERMVALKILGRLPDQKSELQKELFFREVHALSTLSHPAIVQLLGYGLDETNEQLYIVLEYIEKARTLRDQLPVWQPSVLESIEFAGEILDAVAHAHQSHVIHRDLNPANILIDDSGVVKIIDFGISKILGNLAAQQTLGSFYTRPYASPEQIAQTSVGFETDIYSVAAILFFMLSRKEPEQGRSLSAQFDLLAGEPLVGLTDDLLSVMRRMSEDNSSDRYATASHAVLALRRTAREYESASRHYYVQLTRAAIRNLGEQAVIARQDDAEAKAFVQQALTESTFLYLDPDSNPSGNEYDLVGEDVCLRCMIANRPGTKELTHFVAVSAKARLLPHEFERRRQQGLSVNGQWKVGVPGDRFPANFTRLSGLLDEADSYFNQLVMERQKRQRRLDLIDTWRNILFLDRDLKSETLKRIQYVYWSLGPENAVIRVRLATHEQDLILDEVFSAGQLLVMPSKRGKPVPVGRYLQQEGRELWVARIPGVDPDTISSAGEITVDERQWGAAWNRQRLALDAVLDGRCANSRLPEVLVNPGRSTRIKETLVDRFFHGDLDVPKKDAVCAALSSQDLYLIQGPPGTGKTVLISEIIGQVLAKEPQARVLLVSQSNVAVDHAMKATDDLLCQSDIRVRMVRLGREIVVATDAQDYMLEKRVAEWANQIRQNCSQYLASHNTVAEATDDLAPEIELLVELEVLAGQAKDEMSEDIEAAIGLLLERFPQWQDEVSKDSIEAMVRQLREKIGPQKTEEQIILEEWMRRVGRLSDFEDTYLRASSIVSGTCVGIAGLKSLPDQFDWVIVDEAGRATPSEILIPLVRAKRAILVGDHKQLPPVIEYGLREKAFEHPDIDQVWLERSLFEHLFELLPEDQKTVLRVQYRMHPHIANLIGDVFYREEQLQTGISYEKRSHGWDRWRTSVVWCSTSQLGDRHETTGNDGSKFNLCEVEVISSQLKDLERHFRKSDIAKTVAVITGYSAQVEQLKRDVDPSDRRRWKSLQIEINTVDAFQGRERDIVFYSVVRSNPKRQIGFLADSRRLNVALSRARELLFIVGDHRMLTQAFTPDGPNPFVEVIRHIMKYPSECTLDEMEA